MIVKNITQISLVRKQIICIFFMELDSEWINNFEKMEEDYTDFYKDDIKYIKIYSLLVNKNLILENIQEENIFLEEKNKLTKNELISVLNKYKNSNKKIKLISILKYNINLDSNNVIHYLNKNTNTDLFLESINSIDEINFEPSISMFEDLNSIFLIFYEKENESSNQTKKIVFQKKHRNTKKKKP